MVAILPQIQEELSDPVQPRGRRGGRATEQKAAGVLATASDFLVVQKLDPMPKTEPKERERDGKRAETAGAQEGSKMEEGEEDEKEEDGGDQDMINFDPSSFPTDLQSAVEGEHLTGLRMLARFGIYHKSSLVVAVSNLVQEVGDVGVAMKALRAAIARADQPDAEHQTDDASTDDEGALCPPSRDSDVRIAHGVPPRDADLKMTGWSPK